VNVVKPTYHLAWLTSRLGATVVEPLSFANRAWSGLIDDAGQRIALALEPVPDAGRTGTTLALHLTGVRRGDTLEITVRADGATTQVQTKINGALVKERTFRAKRSTDVELLSRALELGEVDPLSPSIMRTFVKLVG